MGDQSKPVKHSSTGKNFVGKTDELLSKIEDMLPTAGVAAR
jgi:hypothetical protein